MFRHKSLSLLLLVVLAFGQIAGQSDQDEHDGDKPVAQDKTTVQFPFKGVVTAEKLHVRISPKMDPSSIIVTILSENETVIVLGQEKDFYQIYTTKAAWGWIFGKNIKVKGDKGVISVKEAPLRIDARVQATQIGNLKEGDSVTVLNEHLGWYKVEAPANVKLWAKSKYVKYVEPADAKDIPDGLRTTEKPIVKKPLTGDDAKAKDLIKQAETLAEMQNQFIKMKQIEKMNYTEVIKLFDQAAKLAKDPVIKKHAEDNSRIYSKSQAYLTFTITSLEELTKKLNFYAEIVKKIKAEEEALKAKNAPKKYMFTGYIDFLGFGVPNRPGTHKIMNKEGNTIVCFLRAANDNESMIEKMNGLVFSKSLVGVNGTLIKDPKGWIGYTVILVDEIDAVKDEEVSATKGTVVKQD